MTTLGATLGSVSPGAVEIALRPTPAISQQHGFVHAGAVSAIADSAAGYAALSLMPADTGVLTTEFKINLLAPAAGEQIVARGRVVKAGRTLTLAQAEVFAITGGAGKADCFSHRDDDGHQGARRHQRLRASCGGCELRARQELTRAFSAAFSCNGNQTIFSGRQARPDE